MQGKGEIKTYYIVGLENFYLPIPAEMDEDIERKQSLILVDMDYRPVSDRQRIQSVQESENYEVFQSNDSRRLSDPERARQQEQHKSSNLSDQPLASVDEFSGQATAEQAGSEGAPMALESS